MSTRTLNERRRIYLDNAATSWPKPEAVYQTVDDYQRQLGAPAGRSAYAEAALVEQRIDVARRRLAALLGVGDASLVIFTCNGTDALNMAIHGLLAAGDHVITSDAEHNSTLRPLSDWQQRGAVTITRVPCNGAGVVDPDDVRAALRRSTRLIALSHSSNVTGAVQPVEDIGRIAREAGVLVLCDAAQSAGHLPLDLGALNVDLLATPGHKGLLGPLGTGVLALGERALPHLRPTRQGGTGTQSELDRQPEQLPSRFESGNLNVPGILGLGAGVGFLLERGLEALETEAARLTDRLITGLRTIETVRVFGPAEGGRRVPLVSITVKGYDPQEIALGLDAMARIAVRAGLHCAPAMHASLGTLQTGGTVRFSLGPFNTTDDVDAAIDAVEQLTAS